MTLERVRTATGSLPSAPYSRRTLTLRRSVLRARKEAAREGSSLVDTQHLLLSVSNPEAEPAAGILRDLGASEARIREALKGLEEEPLREMGEPYCFPSRSSAGPAIRAEATERRLLRAAVAPRVRVWSRSLT